MANGFVHVIESPSADELLDGRTEGRVLGEALVLLCQTESRGLAFLQRFVVKSSPGGI
jgi:hypothetical protein